MSRIGKKPIAVPSGVQGGGERPHHQDDGPQGRAVLAVTPTGSTVDVRRGASLVKVDRDRTTQPRPRPCTA